VPLTAETVAMIERVTDVIREEIHAAGGALTVVALAQEVLEAHTSCRNQWDLLRTAAIRSALQEGYTFADVANVTGLSRQRIQQLAEMPPAAPGRRPAHLDRSNDVEQVIRRRDLG
jgi:hypothetical protein